MFSRRKDSVNISGEEPIFNVRYAGNIETQTPTGKGCTVTPLRNLWDDSPQEKHMKKITIQISMCGIFMNDADKKTKQFTSVANKTGSSSVNEGSDMRSKHFSVEDISYCAADKNVNDRIFCWIYKHPVSGKLYLHAVLCSGKEKAKAMAAVMSRVFRLAYAEWKCGLLKAGRRKGNTLVSSGYKEGQRQAQITPKSSTMKTEMMKMMMMMKSSSDDAAVVKEVGSGEDNSGEVAKNAACKDNLLPAVSWSSNESFPSREGDLRHLVVKDAH